MARNNKKTATVVVRSIARGADTPNKSVLAPLKELNRRGPLVSPPAFAPRLPTLPLPPVAPYAPLPPPPQTLPPLPHMPVLQLPNVGTPANVPAQPIQRELASTQHDLKPWKESRSVPKQWRWRSSPTTRTAGRAVGNEWASSSYVCGPAVETEWDCEADAGEDGEYEYEGMGEDQYIAHEDGERRGRVEVHIMDIAKPAKRRGESLLFRE